ncbi:5854_t:CDS:2 [Cetraspora pellucida]|uniref:5854_t:CDS:1 n=1 Tax=Cetraspora pellucida TaxID=1433469 RepID=A0A9N9ITK1_9GLOM|nr:5854_t:CDS:2 [Cetraspora pellucida]
MKKAQIEHRDFSNIINEEELFDRIILETNYEAYNNSELKQNNEFEQIIESEQSIQSEQSIEHIIKFDQNIESKQKIINKCYSTNKMELIGSQEFTKLKNIPNSLIGVYEAALA